MAQQSALQRDYKLTRKRQTKRVPYAHWFILMTSIALFGVIFFLLSDIAVATRLPGLPSFGHAQDDQQDGFSKVNLQLDLPQHKRAKLTESPEFADVDWETVVVRNGDSLSTIFSRLDINAKDLHKVVRLGKPVAKLKRLLPGEELKFLIADKQLQELVYVINDAQSLHVLRSGDSFIASDVTLELDKRIAYAAGAIESSLFIAAQEAGIPGSMTMELANIFGWDIDFVLDVKTGDRFSLIYEELYIDGKKVRNGEILAAEFVNGKKHYRAVRYINKNNEAEYYTPGGKSMRKLFLRTPVDFTRISSKFGKRFHPVLNRMRHHMGVDYAAPSGTPIRAAGDGKITFRGKKGGYGKTVIIQHGGKYSTLYAHMKSFKRGLKRGSEIKQGQIIGYVGSSGLATGPHLHYEFRVNGVHRNPLTVKLPDARPITAELKQDFKLNTQGYLTLLNTLGQTKVALSSAKSGKQL